MMETIGIDLEKRQITFQKSNDSTPEPIRIDSGETAQRLRKSFLNSKLGLPVRISKDAATQLLKHLSK